MSNSQHQIELILGEGGVHCLRCGRPLTNPKSVERGYGPVCWQKIEVELWFGDVAIPEGQTSTPLTHRKSQIPQLVEALIVAHRTLDIFFVKDVPLHRLDVPIPQAVLVEV